MPPEPRAWGRRIQVSTPGGLLAVLLRGVQKARQGAGRRRSDVNAAAAKLQRAKAELKQLEQQAGRPYLSACGQACSFHLKKVPRDQAINRAG